MAENALPSLSVDATTRIDPDTDGYQIILRAATSNGVRSIRIGETLCEERPIVGTEDIVGVCLISIEGTLRELPETGWMGFLPALVLLGVLGRRR